MGRQTRAIGGESLAVGNMTDAEGAYSVATGLLTDANGTASVAMGNQSSAEGNGSMAFGLVAEAFSFAEIAVGTYSDFYTPNSTTNWDVNDRIFSVGNGTSSANRNNALTIYKSGNAVFDGELQRPSTGNANLVPIAYGTINDNGTIINGTGNFTADLVNGIFEITVNNETLSSSHTVCAITPRSLQPRTASFEFSSSNKLFVVIYDPTNSTSLTPTDFQFVIYKL